jgi:hypothetical protein
MKKMLGLGVLCMLLVVAGSVNAQVVKEINFSAAEGYSDGLLTSQPAGADDMWKIASANQGDNVFTVANEALLVHPDGTDKIWLNIQFPIQKAADGPLTITWDWQYFGPEEKKMDLGFAISDKANQLLNDDPFAEWSEQGSMTRMADAIDARKGDYVGGGSWTADEAVPYRDGVKVYMRMVLDLEMYDFNLYAQREGEDEILVAEFFPMRRMPSEETDGVNCLTMWCHGGDPETSVVLDNILIVGPTAVSDWALY